MAENISDADNRLHKRQDYLNKGVSPYPARVQLTITAGELLEQYNHLKSEENDETTHSLVGRIVAKRRQGKIAFLRLKDESGEIQIFARQDLLGEDSYELVKATDVGDFLQFAGYMTRTKTGELSLVPTGVELATKSLRPLPEKFHGLADKETRYRQRYADLIANDEVKATFITRQAIMRAARQYNWEAGFAEVETPILHSIQGGAVAKPFITHHNALDKDFYLRIAPELYLKRLLVGGFEKVFELGRSFRNEGMDHSHNPEFTTLEAYAAYYDWSTIADYTEGLIKYCVSSVSTSGKLCYGKYNIDFSTAWPRTPMLELVAQVVGEAVSFEDTAENIKTLTELAHKHGITVQKQWGAGKIVTELYDELVEPTLIQPTFVIDYPIETSPLAKPNADKPGLVERFELVIAGKEIANGFSELNDPVIQRERFTDQAQAKLAGDDEAMEVDEDYIRALEYGMPPAGGVGVGMDRLVMLLTNSTSIRDVLLFPHMRDED